MGYCSRGSRVVRAPSLSAATNQNLNLPSLEYQLESLDHFLESVQLLFATLPSRSAVANKKGCRSGDLLPGDGIPGAEKGRMSQDCSTNTYRETERRYT